MQGKRIIKSIGYNQHQIISDMLYMHNNGQPIDVDITYSSGKFYGDFKDSNGNSFTIERPKYCFDIEPQYDYVGKLDPWGKIPLEDKSINSIMIDLPFFSKTQNTDEKFLACCCVLILPEISLAFAINVKRSRT